MERDYISTNFFEIVAGTRNRTARAYVETAKEIDAGTPKAMKQLKNFITSIENLASKENVKDSRISSTKGNMTAFTGYDNIKTAMNFLDKNLGKIDIMKDLHTIYEALKSNQPQYTEGYEKNIRLVVLEYESAMYLLITGLSMSMAENIDVVQNGVQIKIQKKSGRKDGPIISTLHEFANQLSNKSHKEYLEGLITSKDNMPINTNIEESTTFMEGSISDTFELIDNIFSGAVRIARVGKRFILSIKNSIFGILPLIRSILYLRYKKKADTILALDQQVQFINMNIEQLENMKNMDPAKKAEIIKKQKAYVEKYKKKAAKLRAELSDGEREASASIKKEDPEMKKVDDGDFVLEGVSIEDIFNDSDFFEQGQRTKKRATSMSFARINDKRIHSLFAKFGWFANYKSKKVMETENHSKLCKECYEEFFNKTKKPSIGLTPIGNGSEDDSDMKNRTKTKIGGKPYWPKKDEYPMYLGDPMAFLAQLNFSELPNLPGFPTSGLLQFFIGTMDDTGKKVTSCIFHTSFVSENEMLLEIPESPIVDEDFPIKKMYLVDTKIEEIPMSVSDENFSDVVTPIYNRVFNDDVKDIVGSNKCSKELWKLLASNPGGCRIGGNPYFTQSDPRDSDDEVLLLQLDSYDDMIWGDYGVANFFISKSNLASKKFKGNVTFTWDCM